MESRHSVNKKNWSRPTSAMLPHTASMQKRHYGIKKHSHKFEVTCVRCKFTKEWTQEKYDKHMWKVHNIRNEIHIGADPRPLAQKLLFV